MLDANQSGKMNQGNDRHMESFKQQLIDPATLLSKQSKARDSATGIQEELANGRPDDSGGEDDRTLGGEANVDIRMKANTGEAPSVVDDKDDKKEKQKPTEMTDGI